MQNNLTENNLLGNKKYFVYTKEEVIKELASQTTSGLSTSEAELRIERFGYNQLAQGSRKKIFTMFLEQFKSFMILVLLMAAIVSGILGEKADAIIIIAIVVVNAILGVMQENKAENSLAALQKMSSPHAKVIRDGHMQVIEAANLVPGDIVVLETGDAVPADMRLIEAINLKIQEASLTGESVPVEKNDEVIDKKDTSLGDQYNMAFSSSMITYGRGKGVVTATGMNTEVGKIAKMIQQETTGQTPMQKRLDALGKTLGIAILGICIVIFLVGTLYDKEAFEMFMVAVSLAVAAIPEGLPAIATIVLAMGVQRMVSRNAIIRTLPSVETLGSATVICSDKTGTLTQNRMTVKFLAEGGNVSPLEEKKKCLQETDRLLVECSILCNDTKLDSYGKVLGDPTETALVDMGLLLQQNKNAVEAILPRVAEVPFDSSRKLMSTVHQKAAGYRVYTKGAVDELIGKCNYICWKGQIRKIEEKDLNWIKETNHQMAQRALRVLGMAYKDIDVLPSAKNMAEIESGLIFLGMVGMIDPPREEAKQAVATCRTAGIVPVMITGDHLITAKAIAGDLGILTSNKEAITGQELEKMTDDELTQRVEKIAVYARVSPEHKLRIIDCWQHKGHVVAMTGDGVNDAPALKRADIGAAMGITGTDVSKEAADMVLTDDNFATIVSAVEEGRRIYDNILKAVQFLLSCNIGEIITLFVAVMFNWATPLLPIHILWVNLVTDSLPALALGVDPAEPDIMQRKARPNQKIFSRGMIWRILYQGVVIGLLTLFAFIIGSRVDLATGQTMSFSVLAFSQLFHSFNIRSNKRSILLGGFTGNNFLLTALLISAILMLTVLSIPFLSQIFHLATLDLTHILVVLGLSIAPIPVVELCKLLKINTIAE